MKEEIFIARQPILDRNQSLFAYEILFRRKKDEKQTSVIDDTEATLQVLDNTLNNVGISKLVGKYRAFINCNYDLLIGDILYMLDKNVFVLEILESVEIDDYIVNAIKEFHEKGYTIAIDDFVPSVEEYKRILPLLPYTSIVKLEFPAIPVENIEKTVKTLHAKNIKVLAEKIETEADFKVCYAAGCDYFQGYFFAKPENLSADKINISSAGVIQLLNSVNAHLEINELDLQFKRQPELSVNLVKYLNSAHFAMRSQITSIRHAITMLGYDNLKRWLLILAYADKNGAKLSQQSPLLSNAIHRGTLFEELIKIMNLDKSTSDKAFLMGLISHLDALYKVPMKTILEQLPLDEEINLAIMNREGTLGKLFTICQAIEEDNVEILEKSLNNLSISMENFNSALLKAYEAGNN